MSSLPRPALVGKEDRSKSLPSSSQDEAADAEAVGGLRSSLTLRRKLKDNFIKRDGDGNRNNHLLSLLSERKARQRYLSKLMRRDTLMGSIQGSEHGSVSASRDLSSPVPVRRKLHSGTGEQMAQVKASSDVPSKNMLSAATVGFQLTDAQKEQMQKMSAAMKDYQRIAADYRQLDEAFPIEIRLDNLSYSVPLKSSSNKIQTVYNSSIIYKIIKFFKNLGTHKDVSQRGTASKLILDQISLTLKPGRMYLLLGPPASGKTTLLKAIGGRLSTKHGEQKSGRVSYNGKSFEDKTHFHIENAIAFIDQLDRHAPRLTVDETFEFAFQCKGGGTNVKTEHLEGHEEDVAKAMAKRPDADRLYVNLNLALLGLTHVKDTYVGDDQVRGVSGGQRRRVTAGEMMLGFTPVLLGDEISNGLDASSTFEIIQILTYLSKEYQKTRVISLLQPSPETVALFDEIILLAEGKVLFAGPIAQVEDYFAELGYRAPPYMDVADFLQLLSTPADCQKLFHPPPDIAEYQRTPYSADQLAARFRNSLYGEHIKATLRVPYKPEWDSSHAGVEGALGHLNYQRFYRKYSNGFPRSVFLNLKRNLTLWVRDRRVLIANAAKNIIMGISVGGVFFQTDDVVSLLGVLFQGMLFIMLGAMTTAPGFVDERIIFYKQADANFFSAYPFVLGKAVSKLPQIMMDCVEFGTILYFMVGLATTPQNYFIFMAIIISFSILMHELLFVFATFARTKDMVQVASACLLFFFILFSGFIIAPAVVPNYYAWIYWYNPMAWAYRALIINQYRSPEYTQEEGDEILTFAGFVDNDGRPFTIEWIGYTFAYLLLHTLITMLISAVVLQKVRIRKLGGVSDEVVEILASQEGRSAEPAAETNIYFKPVTMTFEDICYDVKASTGNEMLRLLNNIDGAFRTGRMCALMGSSGAGKTTLMDVIALRKTTGTVEGDMRLNGYPQDPVAFRRCSGYVEQFNTLTPQLTVRETVLFSARLRLDAQKVEKDEAKRAFVDEVLKTLELTPLADMLVGSTDEGGLSFEQRKRLSVAVELAASPSILFLDEPTTGLDARNALLVVKLLRKIADQGRTICATIHQPSSAVFDMFDDLLLLKTGGKVVYCGQTGDQSKDLIRYFEENGAQPIEIGDNPANWMLREIQSDANPKDLAEEYLKSKEYTTLKEKLREVRNTQIGALEITFPGKFAAPSDLRQRLMNKRLQTVYWRSPTYNLSRLLVCSIIAFILGSIFLGDRHPQILTESDMRASLSVIFLSFIIIGILSITSVLPVMLSIRDVFYRHRASGMLDNVSLGWALGTAEKWFIVLASFLFCVVFLGVSGISTGLLRRAIRFWGIFTFNLAIYSYFGQAFMCLVPSMTTAQILSSVFIGLNNFFSGLIVRPQFMTGFFQVTYWITPGHYVYEGLVLAQYHGDQRTVIAVNNSEFYDFLGCSERGVTDCSGTVEQYVYVFFGGRFNKENELQDIMVLALFLVTARVMTFYALRKFNFLNA